MICCLKTGVFSAILVGGMARENGGDIEYDGSFLESQGVLGGGLMSKCIIPGVSR